MLCLQAWRQQCSCTEQTGPWQPGQAGCATTRPAKPCTDTVSPGLLSSHTCPTAPCVNQPPASLVSFLHAVARLTSASAACSGDHRLCNAWSTDLWTALCAPGLSWSAFRPVVVRVNSLFSSCSFRCDHRAPCWQQAAHGAKKLICPALPTWLLTLLPDKHSSGCDAMFVHLQ